MHCDGDGDDNDDDDDDDNNNNNKKKKKKKEKEKKKKKKKLDTTGAWGRTRLSLCLPREFGCSCSPESGVAPFTSDTSNPPATFVRVRTTAEKRI